LLSKLYFVFRTGKSFLLRKLTELGISGLFFTALTGIAALNISGSTLHGFAGVGTYVFWGVSCGGC
jgi:hypothetical protein